MLIIHLCYIYVTTVYMLVFPSNVLCSKLIYIEWCNIDDFVCNRRCNNFHEDITDSEIYSHLIKQIAPPDKGVTMEALSVSIFIQIGVEYQGWQNSYLQFLYLFLFAQVFHCYC